MCYSSCVSLFFVSIISFSIFFEKPTEILKDKNKFEQHGRANYDDGDHDDGDGDDGDDDGGVYDDDGFPAISRCFL